MATGGSTSSIFKGVHQDATKLTTIIDWSQPPNLLNLASFLGLAGYVHPGLGQGIHQDCTAPYRPNLKCVCTQGHRESHISHHSQEIQTGQHTEPQPPVSVALAWLGLAWAFSIKWI